jgi:hypothetical protein
VTTNCAAVLRHSTKIRGDATQLSSCCARRATPHSAGVAIDMQGAPPHHSSRSKTALCAFCGVKRWSKHGVPKPQTHHRTPHPTIHSTANHQDHRFGEGAATSNNAGDRVGVLPRRWRTMAPSSQEWCYTTTMPPSSQEWCYTTAATEIKEGEGEINARYTYVESNVLCAAYIECALCSIVSLRVFGWDTKSFSPLCGNPKHRRPNFNRSHIALVDQLWQISFQSALHIFGGPWRMS